MKLVFFVLLIIIIILLSWRHCNPPEPVYKMGDGVYREMIRPRDEVDI
jgi:hypothetical protein